jgi:hypothetical protein
MGLVQNAAKGTNGNFGFPRHDGSVDGLLKSPYEFDVTAFLAGFDEAHSLKPAPDLAERLRLKPPQPQPRRYEAAGDAWREAVRSEAPVLPSSSRAPLLRFHLGLRRRAQDIERHTIFLRAKPSPQMAASSLNCFTNSGPALNKLGQFARH